MIKINNLFKNKNIELKEKKGPFSLYEHVSDLSNGPGTAQIQYFMQKMNVRRRQVLCEVGASSIRVQAGAMQWVSGKVESETGLGKGTKALGGFLKGAVKGLVTGESAVKPVYSGEGYLMLEPTFQHILLEDVSTWGPDGIVLENGMFLACETSLEEKVIPLKNLSALFGSGESAFNLVLKGKGIAALESYAPREELIEFELQDDQLKIDGSMAVAWSGSLEFTVERSSKSLMGSLVNGEGLVNVYRGTGKVLMAPTMPDTEMDADDSQDGEDQGKSGLLSAVGKLVK